MFKNSSYVHWSNITSILSISDVLLSCFVLQIMVLFRYANPCIVIYYKFTINPGGFRYWFLLPILLQMVVLFLIRNRDVVAYYSSCYEFKRCFLIINILPQILALLFTTNRSVGTHIYHIGGVTVNVLASCCFSVKRSVLRRKSKDWLAQNQDNVSEWGYMCISGLLF